MAYRVDVTEPAEVEILEIATLIAAYSPAASDRWLTGISRSIRSLAIMPKRCPKAPESHELGTELRQLMYGKSRNIYRIVLRVVEPALVEVIAVRHGSRDVMRPGQ